MLTEKVLPKLYKLIANHEKDSFENYLAKCCQKETLYNLITIPFEDDSNLLCKIVLLKKDWCIGYIEYIFNKLEKREQKKILDKTYDMQFNDQLYQNQKLKNLAYLNSQADIFLFLEDKESELSFSFASTLLPLLIADEKDKCENYLTEYSTQVPLYEIITEPLSDGEDLLYKAIIFDKEWFIKIIFDKTNKLEQKQILNKRYDSFLPNNPDNPEKLSLIGIALQAQSEEISIFLEQKATFFFLTDRSGDKSLENLKSVLDKIKTGPEIKYSSKTLTQLLPSSSFSFPKKRRRCPKTEVYTSKYNTRKKHVHNEESQEQKFEWWRFRKKT